MSTRPPFLIKNDTIGIISPARFVEESVIENAQKIIESWGFKVELGKHLFEKDHQFSALDKNRAEDFNQMMANDQVKAILCAGGGYGCIRTMDHLKLTGATKWLCGFSDITIYHQLFHQTGMASIHSTMPVKFDVHAPSTQSLKMGLMGKLNNHHIPDHRYNISGEGRGEIVGGNLSILYSMLGTNLDVSYDNKILFIEEVDEYYYHIDRMLRSLKLAGKLDKLQGLIVGGFTDMHDNETPFGQDIPEIIQELLKDADFPICFDFPAGHENINRSLYLGVRATMEVHDEGCLIQYQF